MKNTKLFLTHIILFIVARWVTALAAFLSGYATTSDLNEAKFVGKYLYYPVFFIQIVLLAVLYWKRKNLTFLAILFLLSLIFISREIKWIPSSFMLP